MQTDRQTDRETDRQTDSHVHHSTSLPNRDGLKNNLFSTDRISGRFNQLWSDSVCRGCDQSEQSTCNYVFTTCHKGRHWIHSRLRYDWSKPRPTESFHGWPLTSNEV